MSDERWHWLVDTLIHISHQIRQVDEKVDVLLKNSDFSREDASVRSTTQAVVEATERIPTP